MLKCILQVYVKAAQYDTTDLYGKSDEKYSTFTGYLLMPAAHDAPTGGK